MRMTTNIYIINIRFRQGKLRGDFLMQTASVRVASQLIERNKQTSAPERSSGNMFNHINTIQCEVRNKCFLDKLCKLKVPINCQT